MGTIDCVLCYILSCLILPAFILSLYYGNQNLNMTYGAQCDFLPRDVSFSILLNFSKKILKNSQYFLIQAH